MGIILRREEIAISWKKNAMNNESLEIVELRKKIEESAAVMLFMPGEPLLLSELSHRGKTGLTYLCGGKGGLIHLNHAILVDENADRASKLR